MRATESLVTYINLDLPWLGSLWPVRLEGTGEGRLGQTPVKRESYIHPVDAWTNNMSDGINAPTRTFAWNPEQVPETDDPNFCVTLYNAAVPSVDKHAWLLTPEQANSIAVNPLLPSKSYSHACIHAGPDNADLIRLATLYARATANVGYRELHVTVGANNRSNDEDITLPSIEKLWPEMILFRKRRGPTDDFVFNLRCTIEIRTVATQSARDRMRMEVEYRKIIETYQTAGRLPNG